MKRGLAVCMCMALLLKGCGLMGEEIPKEHEVGEEENAVTLVLADFGNDYDLQQQVEIFNQSHGDYQIEIRQYQRFEQEDGDGIERLQREIVSGNGPDIINFGYGYSVTDILGKYTEDLFPYLENNYFTNILQAFSYEDGLYAMPVSFTLNTFATRSSLVGERESWSMKELISCYESAREKSGGELMLYPGEMKKDVFGTFLLGSVGNYVDWEQGTCSFNGEEFKKIMEFANQFPETLLITEEFSPMGAFASGKAMLYPVMLSSVYDICDAELILGEPVTYIGYPVEGADGTVIEASDMMLAISSVSKHKEIAWEFLSQFLEEEYQSKIERGFPVNKSALEKQLQQGLVMEYRENTDGSRTPVARAEIIFEGEEPIKIYQMTRKETEMLLALIERASIGSAYDSRLHTILLEEVDSYFLGDKTLDETVAVMQGRAQMYVGEL